MINNYYPLWLPAIITPCENLHDRSARILREQLLQQSHGVDPVAATDVSGIWHHVGLQPPAAKHWTDNWPSWTRQPLEFGHQGECWYAKLEGLITFLQYGRHFDLPNTGHHGTSQHCWHGKCWENSHWEERPLSSDSFQFGAVPKYSPNCWLVVTNDRCRWLIMSLLWTIDDAEG